MPNKKLDNKTNVENEKKHDKKIDKNGTLYTVGFAAIVCLICAIFVSSLAVALQPMQNYNRELDRQKNVLLAAGLVLPEDSVEADEISNLFKEKVKELKTDNGNQLYEISTNNKIEMVVLPIEGKGLWSTIYGFIAIDKDATTIRGIAFYQHGETPGLGGEIDNPRWQKLWKGRRAFDDNGKPAIHVIKGYAGAPNEDPHKIDGLSGATLTSNGITKFIQYWLGDKGYGQYLKTLAAKRRSE